MSHPPVSFPLLPETPPDTAAGTKYSRTSPAELDLIAQAAHANPGQWIRAIEFEATVPAGRQATYWARDVKRGSFKALVGAEAIARTINGKGVVWVRLPATETQESPRAPRQQVEFVYPNSTPGMDLELGPELVDAIAARVADLVLARLSGDGAR